MSRRRGNTTAPAGPVVVVGAGLAGMAAALALARAGHRVLVLEAGAAAGGCCSTTTRAGFTFNNGAVYVAVPSLLRHAFAALGLDFDREVPLARIARPHLTRLDDDTVVHLSAAAEARVEGPGGASRSEALREGLDALQRRWGPLYRTLVGEILPHEPSLPRMLRHLWRHLGHLRGNVDALIERHFPDPALQAAVASTLLYTGRPPQQLPATQIIGLVALLEEGFHLPQGGMGAISGALERALRAQGVDIRFGMRVRRIVTERGRVRAVLAGDGDGDGDAIACSAVVATCSGFEVVERLLPADAVPHALRRRAARAPLSHRAISIQAGCEAGGFPDAFIVTHVPPMREQGRLHLASAHAPRWLSYTRPTQVLPGLAPPGKSVVELFAPVSGIARAADWSADMTWAATERHLEALAARLQSFEPVTVRTLDPPAFAAQRFLYEGALYGVAPGVAPDRLFPHRTPVAGLHLAGQSTFPGYGVGPALVSGIQAAALLR